MKELSRKVFLTIFGILSAFLLISLVSVNVQSYQREYEAVMQNLHFMDDSEIEKAPAGQEPPELENMRILDYDVYTVEIADETISKTIHHGTESSDFDSTKVAKKIMKSYDSDTLWIGNMYSARYSFHYRVNRTIVILNNESVSKRLWSLLQNSIFIGILAEIAIAILARMIMIWITKPAKESFDKQRAFIADASHELKTPLAIIMASSDELVLGGNNEKYIENIRYEAERMNKLIAGLLDLSKLEDGIIKEQYQEENLSKIVEKTALVLEGMAFEQGVFIETDIEENLKCKCSKSEMEKLCSTILDNAVKHSFKDTAVKVTLRGEKSLLVLEITNVGDPIKPGDEERIFERFYRADKARSRAENRYGLGLAIAKQIVVNHHGTIKARSKDGKTVFHVELKRS
ncbi:MAG: HAMP domain-containing histidine kinase [Lachnospiraceae bacterium]|nr:HAMP domain-containing histidine kinase [Lachnospiraceae bacterium]